MKSFALRLRGGWWVGAALGFLAVIGPLTAAPLMDGMVALPETPTPTATYVNPGLLDVPTLPPLPMEGTFAVSPLSPSVSPTPTASPVGITDAEAADQEPTPLAPDFAVFPNPAQGDKATFRFQSPQIWKYQVGVYDQFGEPLTVLTSEGKGLLDVIWSLDQVPEGLYYYRALAVHPDSQTVHKYPVGTLAVEKDPTPTPTPVRKKKKKRRPASPESTPHAD